LTGDGLGGHIVTWTDMRYGTSMNIFAQRIDGDGDIRWGIPGMPVTTAVNVQENPAIATDMAGGAIIAWKDNRELTQTDIYAGKIGSDGGMVPTQVQSWTAGPGASGVTLSWTVSGSLPGVTYVIERAEPAGGAGEGAVSTGGWTTLKGEVRETGPDSFEFTDGTVLSGRQYRYRVSSIEPDGVHLLFESEAVTVPDAAVALYQNRPNPFNPATVIEYYLPVPAHVVVEVYDAAGRSVARLADAVMEAGPHSVAWNGTGRGGDPVSSGVYFCVMRAGKETLRRKMVLLR
ncbi:MAG TPA: FlgD immunoglobulin-like domain containing protein, partial [Candidatus Krumholzibacterium sp.]|nr:FlgD immunoglobulin-like domain containing protein [Candidatus Krumholzibacterium sp.]